MFDQIEEYNTFIRLVRATGDAEQWAQIKCRKPADTVTKQRIRFRLKDDCGWDCSELKPGTTV